MKVLFEGTEEQVKNLKLLVEYGGDVDELPRLAPHFCISNLWQVDDVKGKFNCTDEQAMEVLDNVLSNDSTMNHMWESIDIIGEDQMGLEVIED